MVLALCAMLPAYAQGTLTITVPRPGDESSMQVAFCKALPVGDCAAPLAEAFALVNSEAWRNALPLEITTVRIQLAGAEYRIFSPLLLRWAPRSPHQVTLEIVGQRGATRLSGAVQITNWYQPRDADIPERVKHAVRSRLVAADVSLLPVPFGRIYYPRGYGISPAPQAPELMVSGAPQPVAAWPNGGYGLIEGGTCGETGPCMFSVAGRSVNDWMGDSGLYAHAFWRYDWAARAVPVSGIDMERNQLQLAGRGAAYGIAAGQRVRIENALSELDAPGEWYLDTPSKVIYHYPADGKLPQHSELSLATSLLQIENAKGVWISGIDFAMTRGDTLSIVRSSNVVLSDVSIRASGTRALVIEDSTQSGIKGCVIENSGEGGVVLKGGDRRTLTPAGLFVEDCTIRRFSRRVKTMGFAVRLEGVGHRVSGNVISDAPHTAIFLAGNDHEISGNEIFDVVKETSDAGAVYVGRDFVSHGNMVRGNIFRDIQPYRKGKDVKGVYIDDQASGVTVRENIFARVQQPVFIGGGRDNLVEDNLFFQSSPVLHLDARGVEGQRAELTNPNSTLLRRLSSLPYKEAPFANRFPNLPSIMDDDFGFPKYNVFRNNRIVGSVEPSVSERARDGITVVGNRVLHESDFSKVMVPEARRSWHDFRFLDARQNVPGRAQ